MKSSKQEVIINHPASKLYEIVLDIEKYPEFIPWCTASRIIEKSENKITADLMIRYKSYNEKFRSFVYYNKNELNIEVQYTEGAIKNLTTNWKFKYLNEHKSLLIFNLDFKLKIYPLQKIIEAFYKTIENKMIFAFEERAEFLLKK